METIGRIGGVELRTLDPKSYTLVAGSGVGFRALTSRPYKT